jgi:hypothetical protein
VDTREGTQAALLFGRCAVQLEQRGDHLAAIAIGEPFMSCDRFPPRVEPGPDGEQEPS